MSTLVDVLATLCRKGFGEVHMRLRANGAVLPLRELYETEERMVGIQAPTSGSFRSTIAADGLLRVVRFEIEDGLMRDEIHLEVHSTEVQ